MVRRVPVVAMVARRCRCAGLVGALSAAVAFCCASHAVAGGPDKKGDPAIAEVLFQRGRTFMDQGSLAEACKAFAESQRLDPQLGTLLNLATCHEQQGKTATAWVEFVRAEALARRADAAKRRRYAAEHAAALERRLTRLLLVVPQGSTTPTVELDGTQLGAAAWSTPVPLDPGAHTLTVVVAGQESWRTEVLAPEGPATVRVAIPREALEPQRQQAPGDDVDGAAPDAGLAPAVVGGIVVLGVGVVAVAVGSGFGVHTLSLKSESEEHCDGTLCDAKGVDLVDRAFDASTVSTASLVAGGALVALGASLIALGASEAESTADLALTPSFGGLQLTGSW
ncbi:MAG: tetratricopeptide repeat protein [Deltaproteobacteria bacterium]|jgi:Tfp pilus assembly protein PilF|nr:tetratricopeptide repeat protein [Deltaproteobacteria bacterium]MBW2537301.1 tetratricopeptide repeat protein [Deltaproteobacteria bacterium]